MYEELYNINGYNTETFEDIYPAFDVFLNGIHGETDTIGAKDLPEFNVLDETKMKILYYLLLGRYGNDPIANIDRNQFSVKLFSIIFQYGPTWAERLNIQEKIRNLTDEQIKQGSKAIHNQALNPGTDPSTDSLLELEYINAQNTSNYKKSDMEAFALKWDLLQDDVSERFIKRFRYLFLQIARPTKSIYYGTEVSDEY